MIMQIILDVRIFALLYVLILCAFGFPFYIMADTESVFDVILFVYQAYLIGLG